MFQELDKLLGLLHLENLGFKILLFKGDLKASLEVDCLTMALAPLDRSDLAPVLLVIARPARESIAGYPAKPVKTG
jgi:hypothetical protein